MLLLLPLFLSLFLSFLQSFPFMSFLVFVFSPRLFNEMFFIILTSPSFSRWLCSLIGMLLVGISIICVSRTTHHFVVVAVVVEPFLEIVFSLEKKPNISEF